MPTFKEIFDGFDGDSDDPRAVLNDLWEAHEAEVSQATSAYEELSQSYESDKERYERELLETKSRAFEYFRQIPGNQSEETDFANANDDPADVDFEDFFGSD